MESSHLSDVDEKAEMEPVPESEVERRISNFSKLEEGTEHEVVLSFEEESKLKVEIN